jgi:hypothetical protein
MADRRTLEDEIHDRLKARPKAKVVVPERFACPKCGEPRRPFEIVDVTDVPELKVPMACTQCLIGVDRGRRATEEKTARAKRPPWLRRAGVELKALRDRTLDRWRWTVLPDSPLTPECQQAFLDYLRAWHRMTVDAESPAEFKEPDLPAMEYAP